MSALNFGKIPVGVFSTLVVLAILWLTLTPNPLPQSDVTTFLWFDKIGHFFMFGGLCFAVSFDFRLAVVRGRIREGRRMCVFSSVLFVAAVFFGALIEALQYWMDLGRSAEWADLAADAAGAALFSYLSPYIMLYIIRSE